MRPQVEDIEDDLAAEEENKLINEVGWFLREGGRKMCSDAMDRPLC